MSLEGADQRTVSAMATFEDIARTPRLKIARAKYHVNVLSAKVEAYFAQRPCKLVLMRPEGGNRAHPFFMCEVPIPPEFSLIIGDAIHNLRSALDHTIWQMIGSKASKPRNIQYPFPGEAVDQERFRQLMERREIPLAGENVIEMIMTLNGQPGGDELLYGVHDLDIVDKHRLIVTVSETVTYDFRNMRSGFPGVSTNWLFPTWVRKAPGEKLTGLVADWLEEEAENQPTFFISLEDRPAFVRQEAVTVLRNMANRIEEAINLLITAYLTER